MDDDRNPDRLLTELPPSPIPDHVGPTSTETTPQEDSSVPVNGNGTTPALDPSAKQVDEVIHSDIGVATLLNRLKQSIASAKEFALFLKKRSTLEEEHATGLRKICKSTHDNTRRPEHRQGSYARQYDEVTRIHERMAENGVQFASSLHQMHDDLVELATTMERGRKQWKQTGLTAEQRVIDTENLMRKAKSKYDALAEDYERTRTGDRQAGKKFGLKGPKSAAQHEEDLLRKVQAADQDYASKVQTVQTQRKELLATARPQAIRAIQDLIRECDAALTLQLQKFASFNEKLLLSNGLIISPMNGQTGEPGQPRSLREAVHAINNEQDFKNYITSQISKVPPVFDIKYERHPTLQQNNQIPPTPQKQPESSTGYMNRPTQVPPPQAPAVQPPQAQGPPSMPTNIPIRQPSPHAQNFVQPPLASPQQHERSLSHGPVPQQYSSALGSLGASHYNTGSLGSSTMLSSGGAPQLSSLPFQTERRAPSPQRSYNQSGPAPIVANAGNLPPLKPVFGMTLDELFKRDGSAVPMLVYQSIQAVDLYGLEVEGIYRLSGTRSHIDKIRSMFDNDASQIDFRNPENFFHDVNSVAGLLKQFFREMPDPLLTAESYAAFIEAAKLDDDIVRRDSLHAIINGLPDPNYATLRALTLHLNRVVENADHNRMNASNLAIVFGPTLMGDGKVGASNFSDSGYQVRVIDTILNNCYQIFDDD